MDASFFPSLHQSPVRSGPNPGKVFFKIVTATTTAVALGILGLNTILNSVTPEGQKTLPQTVYSEPTRTPFLPQTQEGLNQIYLPMIGR